MPRWPTCCAVGIVAALQLGAGGLTATPAPSPLVRGGVGGAFNLAPGAPIVTVVPESRRSDETLSLAIVVPSTDPNGDPVTYATTWSTGGVVLQEGETLDPVFTTRGEIWEMKVVPSDGQRTGLPVTFTFLVENALPVVTSVTLEPAYAAVGELVTCLHGFADADSDADQSSILWLEDGIEVGTGPTTTVVDPSAELLCEVLPYDGLEVGAPAMSAALDRAPTQPVITVVPATHRSDELLSVAFVTPPVDPDGGVVTWTTEWSLDGVVVHVGDVLDPVWTTRGEVWDVTVTPSDGLLVGPAATASLTIENAVPSVTDLALAPLQPQAGEAVACTYTYLDGDADLDASSVRWLSDGVEIGTGPEIVLGDPALNLVCEVTPYDGLDTGAPRSVFLDHAPTAPVITVVPDSHRSNETLSIAFVLPSTDPDEAPVTWTTEWSRDGVVVQLGDTLDPALTTRGELWEVTVVPSDGALLGPAATIGFTIENAIPWITSLALDPPYALPEQTVACTHTSSDPDGDADLSTVRWLTDGLEVGTGASFSVVDPTIDLACEVTPFDGLESGVPVAVPLVHPPNAGDNSPLRLATEMLMLGTDGEITVTSAPPDAVIDLYVSTGGEGRPDCLTFLPTCVELLDPQLYATGVADALGEATFAVFAEDFPDTGEISWQPIATDPNSGEPITGFVMVQQVAVSIADADLALVRVTNLVGLGTLDTSGNSHTGGAIWFDYDNDLWPDLFVVNGTGEENMLFQNDGDGTFTWIPGALDKPNVGLEPSGAVYGDVDSDGDYDVFVPVDNPMQMDSGAPQPYEGGPNLLYINDGGVFVESAAASGLVDPRGWRTSHGAFADYDADGCIDLFVANWAMAVVPANDNYSRLMRGNCDGTFDDLTALTGVDGAGRDTLTALWWDANLDGFPDLYVGNVSDKLELPDFDPTANLYYNVGGTSFVDQVPLQQPWMALDSWAAMGGDVGDIDLDGDWDMYVTDVFDLGVAPRGNALYLGNADGSLSANRCREQDVCAGQNSWPTGFADLNRDMWPDLWIGAAQSSNPSLVYVNKGDGTFEHHAQEQFMGDVVRGGSQADYDGDGDVDIFVWANGTGSDLYRNDPVDTHHWLEVKLEGDAASSWDAIGATVYVTAGGVRQMRRVSGGDSAHSQSDAILHFGLGDEEGVELLEVVWPTGAVQSFVDVPIDDIVRVSELDGLMIESLTQVDATYRASTDTLFVEARSSYVGRTELTVDGFGPLEYSAATHRHSGSFGGVTSKPANVTVESVRGASRTKVVTSL